MRVLHEIVIVGMALALVSASALAGGKGGGGNTTKGGNAQYLKYDFRNTVITTTKSGSTGPTKPPLPTTRDPAKGLPTGQGNADKAAKGTIKGGWNTTPNKKH